MAEHLDERTDQALNLLGLARRAGKLFIGQDQVLEAAKTGNGLLVMTSNDVSAAVLRSLKPHEKKGTAVRITFTNIDRTVFGGRLGIQSAQIAALSSRDGFAKKILNIFNDRSDADE